MTTPQPQQQRGYPTATAAVQAQLASAFYSSQAFLAAASVRDILALWQQVNLRDVRSSWPATRAALASLIRDRFGMSASQAVTYYEQARAAAGVPGVPPQFRLPPIPYPAAAPPVPPPAPAPIPVPEAPAPPPVPLVTVTQPSQELISATLDSTGPWGLLGRIKKGQPLPLASQNTGVVMSGAASRLIENGARQVVLQAVQADPQAVAWMRVTVANPCAWCAMLASRGASYKTEQSAAFRAHSHCRCVAVAVWSREDAEALRDNDLYQQWKQVTRGYSKHEAFLAWRRYWDARMGRDGIRVLPAA